MQHSVSDHSYELEAMEDFLTYDEKDLADDEQVLIQSILSSAQKYLTKEDLSHIHHAYEYAAKAHTGQKRLSGEDYITHPLRATQIVLRSKHVSYMMSLKTHRLLMMILSKNLVRKLLDYVND